MFLTEKDLRDAFWKNYNYSKRALKYQFECDVRLGAADLVTVEQFQGNYQINAFEFKLSDIKKAILQAKENAKFVNKSWIVIPDEKKELVEMKYGNILRNYGIGAITVEEGGRWNMIIRPLYRTEIMLNQTIINLLFN